MFSSTIIQTNMLKIMMKHHISERQVMVSKQLVDPLIQLREAAKNILRGGVCQISGLRPQNAYPPIFQRQPLYPPIFQRQPLYPPHFQAPRTIPPQIRFSLEIFYSQQQVFDKIICNPPPYTAKKGQMSVSPPQN